MSEIHKFLFEGASVRGVLVRLTDAWTEVLRRRAGAGGDGHYPQPVQSLLGEMFAAATLMQSNIKFNGSLILQIFGDGPVKLAVVEVQSDFGLRAMAKVVGDVAPDASLSTMLNVGDAGKCAITLDPKSGFPGQQPYQGVVPLNNVRGEKIERLNKVLEHYMDQSEQLETTLVLAADDKLAAGLLLQRVPLEGVGNLAGGGHSPEMDREDDFNRISILASSLKREELLTLDAETILRRLFWEEKLTLYEPTAGAGKPHFACTCSREGVGRMLLDLGRNEAQEVLAERGELEVGCEFCGAQYRFDAVDVAQLFTIAGDLPPSSSAVQ